MELLREGTLLEKLFLSIPSCPHSPPGSYSSPPHPLLTLLNLGSERLVERGRKGGKDLTGQEGSPTAAAARGEIPTALPLADFPLSSDLLKHRAEENCSLFAY